jgi:hypothetical protein
MATFGNQAIFGTGVTFSTSNRPRQTQVNSFFGINGVEVIDGGNRGRETIVSGTLIAPDSASLSQSESVFRNLADGVARELVDSSGNTWQNVLLEHFQPIGRVQLAASGSSIRSYRARFFHLT